MSARLALVGYLEGICAATAGLEDVRVIASVRALDELSKPTLVVKTDSYSKVSAAPRHIAGNFTLTLISKHVDIDRAEAELEDLLELLLPRLFTFGLLFDTATQVDWDAQHIAYDITVMSLLTE